MTDITKRLVELAEGMIKVIPEVRDEGKGYTMFDDGGVETEVGEFLYGLTRILKPKRVLTTGIYTGISDMYIAQGLKDNGYGKSTALEFEPQHLKRAQELWRKTQVFDYINALLISSTDFKPEGIYELMFLDTEPNLRFGELIRFYPHLAEGGYVFIHDAPRTLCQGNVNPDHPEIKSYPFGDVPSEMRWLLQHDSLRMITFPNPRGMVGFYKVHEDDYNANT